MWTDRTAGFFGNRPFLVAVSESVEVLREGRGETGPRAFLRHMQELRALPEPGRLHAVNLEKLHPIDWALAYPLVTEPSIDVGKKLETAVFLHWRRQREDLGYLAGDGEVDLVVNRDGPEYVINVAYTVSASQTWAHDVGSRRPPTGVMVTEAWRYLLGSPTSGA